MIAMLISDRNEKERNIIQKTAREKAALYTEEYWQWIQCKSGTEVKQILEKGTHVDLFCMDVTSKDILDTMTEVRESSPTSYIILVADASVSPLSYMKPSIRAESLMLKPLSKAQLDETLGEAVSLYASRFSSDENPNVFVLESRGSRRLMEYEKILYFEAREKKVFLNTGYEEYGFTDTLDHLNDQLKEYFLRVHRSFLVNKEKILEVYLSQNRIVLEGNVEVPLSRSCKASVKAWVAERRSHGSERKELDSIL